MVPKTVLALETKSLGLLVWEVHTFKCLNFLSKLHFKMSNHISPDGLCLLSETQKLFD